MSAFFQIPSCSLIILSFDAIQSELLSIVKYAVNKNRTISEKKNVEMMQKEKINDVLI
jgi:hypothetical protein